MNACFAHPDTCPPHYGLEEFLPLTRDRQDYRRSIRAIADNLLALFQGPARRQARFSIPSVKELSFFFTCFEMDILRAFEELKHRGFRIDAGFDFYKPVLVERSTVTEKLPA